MKPRYLQSPNQAHPRVTPTSSSASAGGLGGGGAGRFGGKGQHGQQQGGFTYDVYTVKFDLEREFE